MGIFTRFKDIVSSNINSMLDKAENPEKLIKQMIQEMEDTLVEIKASCASVMANKASVSRGLGRARDHANSWETRAALAINKGRDDLAREALGEKRRYLAEVDRMTSENDQLDEVVAQYKRDMHELESKLEVAREKHKALIHRHAQAQRRHQTQTTIRKVTNTDAFARFEALEGRIDRMEAEADLVNVKTKPNLENEIANLTQDDELEEELAALKKSLKGTEETTG
ncbi:MAG: phage shock protein PspA [Verrucomicrobiia bacterium]|jgi:phage shock protein A